MLFRSALTRECASKEKWGCVHKLWLSCLPPELLHLRNCWMALTYNSKSYSCLGDPGISGKIRWPVHGQAVIEVMFYSLRLNIAAADLRWLFIIDLKRSEA